MPSRLLTSPGKPLDSPVRIAVFGTGYWSTLQIPAWREVENVEIVAAYNRTRAKADAVAERFDIPRVYDDPEELLRKENPDLIDVITEVPAHAPLVMLAARHRVPVICQKPMSTDLDACIAMVSDCAAAGVPFSIHENFRWQPPFRAVKRALDDGRIGEPLRATIQLVSGYADGLETQPFLKTLSHPALTDMGSHAFDLARFFFGEARSIYCQTSRSSSELKGDGMATAVLRMGDVRCTCEITDRISSRVFIEGRLGTLELQADNRLYTKTNRGHEIEDCSQWPRYSWVSPADDKLHGGDCIASIVACNQHLVSCLQSGVEAETSAENNLRSMRLVFAAIESAEHGVAVRIV